MHSTLRLTYWQKTIFTADAADDQVPKLLDALKPNVLADINLIDVRGSHDGRTLLLNLTRNVDYDPRIHHDSDLLPWDASLGFGAGWSGARSLGQGRRNDRRRELWVFNKHRDRELRLARAARDATVTASDGSPFITRGMQRRYEEKDVEVQRLEGSVPEVVEEWNRDLEFVVRYVAKLT